MKHEIDDHPNLLRRTLFKGTSVGVGILLAVQAKTALGGQCASPSAILSGNTSPRSGTGDVCSGGRSPGFWKQPKHFVYWTMAVPPTFSGVPVGCEGTLPQLSIDDITNQGTLLSTIFLDAPGVSLWVALAFPNDTMFGSNGQLLRHLSAAWLNSHYFTDIKEKYPVTPGQVQEMWLETRFGGKYYPGGMTSQGWTASEVIDYFEGMYGINDDVPNLCKKNNN